MTHKTIPLLLAALLSSCATPWRECPLRVESDRPMLEAVLFPRQTEPCQRPIPAAQYEIWRQAEQEREWERALQRRLERR